MGQDEAPSPAWLTPNLRQPPPAALLGCPHPHPQLPNPLSPPPAQPRSPPRLAPPGRAVVVAVAAPAVARCPAPPASPGTRDRAAAAGACSRNGHGWAGTAAPRLRARGQQQLVRGFVLDESPRGRPGTKPPPPRPPPPAHHTRGTAVSPGWGPVGAPQPDAKGRAPPVGIGLVPSAPSRWRRPGVEAEPPQRQRTEPGGKEGGREGGRLHPGGDLGERLLQMYIGAFY